MKVTDEATAPRKQAPLLRHKKARPAREALALIPGRDTRLMRIIRLLIILGLLMLPLLWIHHWLDERDTQRQSDLTALTQSWGDAQTIIAPLLLIPYTEHITQIDSVTDKDGETRVISKDIYNHKTAVFLPDTLAVAADLQTQARHKGQYTAQVYTANISLSGRFDHSRLQETEAGDIDIHWDQARVIAGLSDTKTLDESSFLRWGKEHTDNLLLEPGTGLKPQLQYGVHAPLDRTSANEDAHDFKLTLKLRGSDSLLFAPLGRNTTIRMTSPWQQPDFQGGIAPHNKAISEQGFTAQWDIPHLARDYPQYWIQNTGGTEHDRHALEALDTLVVGVRLTQETAHYAPVTRTLNYALLFIALSFAVFFALEQLFKRDLGILHYLISGSGLLLFYPLLLTLSDHLTFIQAYGLAATVITLLTGGYAWLIFRHWSASLLLWLVLAGLYATFYLMQQQATLAPLIATVLGVTALTLLMVITRMPKDTG